MLALLHQSVTKNQMTKIFVVIENVQLRHKQILQQKYFGHLIYGSWSPTDVTKQTIKVKKKLLLLTFLASSSDVTSFWHALTFDRI